MKSLSSFSNVLLGVCTILSVCTLIFGIKIVNLNYPVSFGSVSTGQQYLSTTTPKVPAGTSIATGTGSLGSIVLEGSSSGQILLIDATTSDVNKRTGNDATSSLILGWLPANASTTTYVFDAGFTRGLWLETTSGVPTSTITYRNY